MTKANLELYSTRLRAMGSPCQFDIYCEHPNQAKKITQQLIDEIKRLENKYSRYQPNSVTSKIIQQAGKDEGLSLDNETAQLLHYADSLYQQSDGLFDITSGVLRKAWNFKSNQLPADESLQVLMPMIGWDKAHWEAPYFHLPIAGMEIDFGGFVKEYTADVLATLCINDGIQHGLINLGGDIKVIGPHPNHSPWRVGIQHPRKPETAIATLDMMAGGIATSGDYERYMIVDNKRYSHLLNPITGKSIQPYFASVSVIADACLLSGSFASIAMLKSHEDKYWLNDIGLPFLTVNQSLELGGTLNPVSS